MGGGGYPIPGQGVPPSLDGGTPRQDLADRGVLHRQVLTRGYPPHQDLARGTPLATWLGDTPLSGPDLAGGYPPPQGGQTENITSCRTTYAGGKNCLRSSLTFNRNKNLSSCNNVAFTFAVFECEDVFKMKRYGRFHFFLHNFGKFHFIHKTILF